MNDQITPQEWRIRREVRAAAWVLFGLGLAVLESTLTDDVPVHLWLARQAAYGALVAACLFRAEHLRPDLPKRCPASDREPDL